MRSNAFRHLQRTAGPALDEYTSYNTEKSERINAAAKPRSSRRQATRASRLAELGLLDDCAGSEAPV